MAKHYLIAGLALGALVACGGDDSSKGDKDPNADGGGTGSLDGGGRGLDGGIDGGGARPDGAVADGATVGTDILSLACSQACVASNSAKCVNDDPATCVSSCVEPAAQLPSSCTDEYLGLVQCAGQATFVCNADLVSEPVGCDSAITGFNDCLVDLLTGDGGPSAPLDAGTRDAAVADAAVTPGQGSDAAAVDAAVAADAGLVDAGAVVDAFVPDMPTTCESGPDDDACDKCGNEKCCDLLTACEDSCQAYAACLSTCAADDDACVPACETAATAEGLAQYGAAASCYASMCAVPCGG